MLAVRAELAHRRGMKKSPRVIFKFQRIDEGDWQIQAHRPDGEVQAIPGFKSKAEIDEWLNGNGRLSWLRANGYAK
jgi:hypothetical protein